MTGRGHGWVVGLVALAALLQTTWVSRLSVGGEWPDLALAMAVVIALLYGREAAQSAGLTAGLLTALLADVAGVAFVLSRVVATLVAAGLGARWHAGNLLVKLAVMMVGVLAAEGLFAVLYPAVFEQPGWAGRVVLRALLTAATAPVVAVLIEWTPIDEEVLER